MQQQLLEHNDGKVFHTEYSDRNFRESRTYTVDGGQLFIRSHGKGAFGGSQFDQTWPASREETHRFLYKYQRQLDHSRVDPKLKLPKPEPVVIAADPALSDLSEEIVEGLSDEATPEASARVVAWFNGLSAREKLFYGTVVVAVVAGGVVVYRYRKPIAHKLKVAMSAVRQNLTGLTQEPGESEDQHGEADRANI
ncbi:hypothetical protein [Microbacterium sp.]|uniref:hypothetical protein n=1 Tax=Microbacterium sp. TaxID=51671 RepID=UPI003F9AD1FC